MKCCTLPDRETIHHGKGDGRKHRGKVKHCSKKQWDTMPQVCKGKRHKKHKR